MRALGWFLLAILGTLLFAALVAYPVWLLAIAIEPDWRFHKVISRFWQLSMLAGVALGVWRLGLRGRADWGYGLPRARFLRQAAAGLALGVATMLPVAVALVALGIREPRDGLDAALWLEGLASGAAIGLAVALIEETFFRGLMFQAVRREAGLALAVASTALLYSGIHFLARIRIPAEEVDWGSGFMLLAAALARYAQPLTIADAFVTLALVGVLLALVRHWTGSIAACIGLHMGWVWVIKTTGAVSEAAPGAGWAWLVSEFDAFTGWLAAGWSLLILLAALRWRGRFARWRAGPA